ncbi:serine protease grass-like [Drosophila rhopaloa]|uniref:Peptidase S1 domain-containing protein n=1 Tax=Drosophila rhopaloa TaxID=1041015 RepID=A0ABM5GVI2_DRORH|nr:serine protease grass-like [Drosophila rhopaloa]
MMLATFLVLFSAVLVLGTQRSAQLLEPGCLPPNDRQEVDPAPWMAYLVRQGAYACSGSLITYNFVLTSGHCADITKNLYVRLGHYQSNGTEDFLVMSVFRHQRYETIMSDDIALLKLNRSLEGRAKIRPICILLNPDLRTTIKAIPSFILTGWSQTKGDTQQTVRQVLVNRVDPGMNEYWCRKQEERFCCQKPAIFALTADPGTPLGGQVLFDESPMIVQFGIFSSGHGDTSYGIYTDVNYHTPWIVATIRQN